MLDGSVSVKQNGDEEPEVLNYGSCCARIWCQGYDRVEVLLCQFSCLRGEQAAGVRHKIVLHCCVEY